MTPGATKVSKNLKRSSSNICKPTVKEKLVEGKSAAAWKWTGY